MQITKINVQEAKSKTNCSKVQNQKSKVSFGALEPQLGKFIARNFSEIEKLAAKDNINFTELFKQMRDSQVMKFFSRQVGDRLDINLFAGRADKDVANFGSCGWRDCQVGEFSRRLGKVKSFLIDNKESTQEFQSKELNVIESLIFKKEVQIEEAFQDVEDCCRPILEVNSKVNFEEQLKLIENKKNELKKLREELSGLEKDRRTVPQIDKKQAELDALRKGLTYLKLQ